MNEVFFWMHVATVLSIVGLCFYATLPRGGRR